jgi:hypothetical protein
MGVEGDSGRRGDSREGGVVDKRPRRGFRAGGVAGARCAIPIAGHCLRPGALCHHVQPGKLLRRARGCGYHGLQLRPRGYTWHRLAPASWGCLFTQRIVLSSSSQATHNTTNLLCDLVLVGSGGFWCTGGFWWVLVGSGGLPRVKSGMSSQT